MFAIIELAKSSNLCFCREVAQMIDFQYLHLSFCGSMGRLCPMFVKKLRATNGFMHESMDVVKTTMHAIQMIYAMITEAFSGIKCQLSQKEKSFQFSNDYLCYASPGEPDNLSPEHLAMIFDYIDSGESKSKYIKVAPEICFV